MSQCPRKKFGITGGNATVRERAPSRLKYSVLETDNVEARSLTAAFPPVLFPSCPMSQKKIVGTG
jgi:hypothetical protein